MQPTPSIGQEFYKVRAYWGTADRKRGWRLAVWVADYADVDLLDKFMEVERSPLGVFDDIFFRFDTEYAGDEKAFEEGLWKEFLTWFQPVPEIYAKYDMYTALKNDGLLKEDFIPDASLARTSANLWTELLRFKGCIAGLERAHFCLYFPPSLPTGPKLSGWFRSVLKTGVPHGIRLATIDYLANRKADVSVPGMPQLVEYIIPKLDTLAAINAEMDKGGATYDATGVEARFRKQIREVMSGTLKKNAALTDSQVGPLITLSLQMRSTSAEIAGLLVAAQAYYAIREMATSESYTDRALRKASIAMESGDAAGYPVWKSCTMLKGALLIGQKKSYDAIAVYEGLALEAQRRGDAFFVMEGYRLCGHLMYEEGRLPDAFGHLLLALVAGSYLELDVRRQSTFLHAAHLALFVGQVVRKPGELVALTEQLRLWLGDDWKALLEDEAVENAVTKRKKSLLEF